MCVARRQYGAEISWVFYFNGWVGRPAGIFCFSLLALTNSFLFPSLFSNPNSRRFLHKAVLINDPLEMRNVQRSKKTDINSTAAAHIYLGANTLVCPTEVVKHTAYILSYRHDPNQDSIYIENVPLVLNLNRVINFHIIPS